MTLGRAAAIAVGAGSLAGLRRADLLAHARRSWPATTGSTTSPRTCSRCGWRSRSPRSWPRTSSCRRRTRSRARARARGHARAGRAIRASGVADDAGRRRGARAVDAAGDDRGRGAGARTRRGGRRRRRRPRRRRAADPHRSRPLPGDPRPDERPRRRHDADARSGAARHRRGDRRRCARASRPRGAARVRVDVPAALPADRGAARAASAQAVLSLLDQRLRRQPAAPWSRSRARGVATTGRTVRIDVRDRGRRHVARGAGARRASRSSRPRSRAAGFGLGLFLARVFAERSGGALTHRVRRRHGGDRSTCRCARSRRPHDGSPMTEARTLLIVDDDAPFRTRLVQGLRGSRVRRRGAADYRRGHRGGAPREPRAGAGRPAAARRRLRARPGAGAQGRSTRRPASSCSPATAASRPPSRA